jgi:hypothetical protein
MGGAVIIGQHQPGVGVMATACLTHVHMGQILIGQIRGDVESCMVCIFETVLRQLLMNTIDQSLAVCVRQSANFG